MVKAEWRAGSFSQCGNLTTSPGTCQEQRKPPLIRVVLKQQAGQCEMWKSKNKTAPRCFYPSLCFPTQYVMVFYAEGGPDGQMEGSLEVPPCGFILSVRGVT